MECPYCENKKTQVLETRKNNGNVKRDRWCNSCHSLFYTVEELLDNPVSTLLKEFWVATKNITADKEVFNLRERCNRLINKNPKE